jgi:hypothetical protein
MASATGIPDVTADSHQPGVGEDEPLLGRAGDASQPEGRALYYNVLIGKSFPQTHQQTSTKPSTGTAVITQVGLILLVASVWASIFLSPLILFSAHPLLNSGGILFLTQAILVLQPTHTETQKRQGTTSHFVLINLALDLLIAGLVIIEINKFNHNGTHFESPHAILGLTTYILLAIQASVGFTQFYVPRLYGGVEKAKVVYKWHRLSGYVILTLLLATVAAATQTDFNKTTLDIKLWAVLVSAVLILIGVIPRIKKQKLGLGPKHNDASGH